MESVFNNLIEDCFLRDHIEEEIYLLSENMQSTCDDFVNILPSIINHEIFSFLSAKDLSNCSLTAKSWREIANSNALWRYHCKIRGWLKFGEQQELLPVENDVEGSNSNKISHPKFQVPFYSDTISKICYWKIIFLKVHHLNENWKNGRYTPYPIYTAHSDKVLCIDCKDNLLASGGLDRIIKLWNLRSKQCETTIHTNSEIYSLLFHNNQLIAGCDNGNILLICYKTGKILSTLMGHRGSVIKLIYAVYLITACLDHSIRLWDLEGKKCIHCFSNHQDDITDIAKFGFNLVSSSFDGSLCIYDLKNPKLNHQLIGHKDIVSCICCDNELVVSGGSDGELFVWSISTGNLFRKLIGHFGDIHAVTMNDELIASASEDTTIRLWYIDEHFYSCKILKGHHLGIVSILNLSNNILISAGHGKKIVVWEWRTERCLHVVHRQPIQLHCMCVSDTRIITASPSSPGSLAIIDYWK
ncbi:DgyrCDS797 [Dimorphilus gyrociliatus]|uniref:DgyrCDS797 n=1 Tax=Dimorphilus gyrociliatus TaxID=2664684 RepID=A0A7I8V776_9ANNE|nr:DgyrCDS797 [Dimorphilus gyrociliatus]